MRPFRIFDVTVKESQRGILRRNGQFDRFMTPGRFRRYDPNARFEADVFDVVRSEIDAETALLLERTQPEIAAKNVRIIQTSETEVAIVSLDGEPVRLVGPSETRAYWTTLTQVDAEIIDTADDPRMTKGHLDKLARFTSTTLRTVTVIEPHAVGLLVIDGAFVETLKPGRYGFWTVGRKVQVIAADLRPQMLEVTAQEILTKDRVGIRVTLAAFFQIVDAEAALLKTKGLEDTLYRLVQFAVREAVATRSLDEILAARDALDKQISAFVSARADELGVRIGDIGIKDVILPGDVRDLLNKVVEAERVAKANLIRRQEETAATRSLLNTSKLMQDNPLLMRLKELEALEKLVEKVGRIDLHSGGGAGGGLETLLSGLYRLDRDRRDDEADPKG
jgi:regulator of protease activity HflC (stomatin/prohibitin superfamily)